MRTIAIRCLMISFLSVFSTAPVSASKSEYGDIIVDTPEYEEITRDKPDIKDDDYRDRDYHRHYHDPFYRPPYRSSYRSSSASGRGRVAGLVYLGISIGESDFDYNDIDAGDATVFHIGFQPEKSHLGYELSFFNSGDSEVTSLTGIELEVETINLVLTANSSKNQKTPLNLFAQGGFYFAKATLSGPSGRVRERSNGFLLAAGIEFLLNRHVRLRAGAYHLHEVEDFANDESISVINLGGQLVF